MRNPRTLVGIILLVAAIGLAQVPVWAQSEATTGAIRGTVTDPSGAVVPNTKVTIKNLDTGYTREVTTGADGFYTVPLLPVGRCEVRVEASGFTTQVQTNVAVRVGQAATVDISLQVGQAQQVVTVQAEVPLVEVTRTQVSQVVDQSAVRELPIHGRNYLDFVLLTPGVFRDQNRTGDIDFGGLKGTYNSLQIDGVDNNNNFFGQALGRTGVRAPFQFSQEAVAEFQVKTNSYSAEFGRAGGAVINVVTKSGTNDWHGSLFTFYRDNRLNANKWENNRAARAKPRLRVWQFGGIASGPIVRDKAFWMFNYDAQRRSDPNPILCPATTGAVAAACALLPGDPVIGPRIQDYQRTLNQDVFLWKADWRINPKHNFNVRYNYQRFTGGGLENAGNQSVREHTGDSLVRTHTLAGTLVSTFSSRWLNEFRAQWGRDSEPGMANSSDPEAVIREAGTTIINVGRNNFSPRETTIKRGQFADSVSYIRGKHTMKFGADFNIERILNFFPGLFGGQYSFSSLADFQDNHRPDGSRGTVGTYTQAFAGSGTSGATTHPNITEYSWFIQDEWRATSNLTMNFGLRYDLQTVNKPSVFNPSSQLAALGVNTGQMNTDTNNFGPRVGFAWSPHWRKTLVLRGGYGIFYARTPAIMTGTATSQNGLQVISVTLSGNSSLLPTNFAYPQVLSAPPTGATPATPNIYAFQVNYVQPKVQQWSLGVETQLAKDWSFGINYLGVKGTHLSRSRDINLGDPVLTTFPITTGGALAVLRFPATRPATSFGRITQFESNGNSIYNAMVLSLNKRFSYHFQAGLNYTWSNSIDDRPESTSVVPFNTGDDLKMVSNPRNIRADRGPSEQDFRHRFVFLYVWDLDYLNKHDNFLVRHVFGHWLFSGILQAQNGKHFNVRLGGDPNRDSDSQTDRAFGVGRDTGTLPASVSFDMRLTHDFPVYERAKFQFMFEAFNLFNHPNFSEINSFQYNFTGAAFAPVSAFRTFSSTFEQPGGGSGTPGAGPRTLELGVKFVW